MNRKFIQWTSGWIPVSMLLLLVMALVTGQAHANLPQETRAADAPAAGHAAGGQPPAVEMDRFGLDEQYHRVQSRIPVTLDADPPAHDEVAAPAKPRKGSVHE